jgi:hypothetical protein
MPKAYQELERIRQTLERHFKDVQDFEFTIEKASSTCCKRGTASAPPWRR